MRTLNVLVLRDEQEGVWFVDSSEIPGLNAEAPAYEQLVDIVLDVAPDLVDTNLDIDLLSIPVCVQHKVIAGRVAAD